MSRIFNGGPVSGRLVPTSVRFCEVPVECTDGIICRAVHEIAGCNCCYKFVGIEHRFHVGPEDYEYRRESSDDWERRTSEGRDYAPTRGLSIYQGV